MSNALEMLKEWVLLAEHELRPLPANMYTAPDVLELEIERLFYNKWICAGHISEFEKSGDFVCLDIIDKPLIIVCDETLKIRAFSNVCRHRASVVAAGSGNCSSFSCPYHAWTYGLDGCLKGAPHMDMSKLTDVKLPEYPVEIWQGLVFVTLADHPEALAPQLKQIESRISAYDCSRYKVVLREEMEFACNWKVLVENFCESYHVFRVHNTTLEPGSPTITTRVWKGGDAFNHHTMTSKPGLISGLPVDRLPDELQNLGHLICVYPCLAYSIDPTTSVWLSVLPTGPQTLKCIAHVAALPDSGSEVSAAYAEEICRFTHAFMAEDKSTIEGVQRGLAADVGSCGVLNEWERTNWEFGHYLARHLLG